MATWILHGHVGYCRGADMLLAGTQAARQAPRHCPPSHGFSDMRWECQGRAGTRLTARTLPLSPVPAMVAVDSSRLRSLAAMRSGPPTDSSRAAAPDTMGVAMLVPVMLANRLPGRVEMMFSPGAARCTLVAPQLEKPDTWLVVLRGDRRPCGPRAA